MNLMDRCIAALKRAYPHALQGVWYRIEVDVADITPAQPKLLGEIRPRASQAAGVERYDWRPYENH